MTKFSINLNKIALLRNSRGRNYPDLLAFARRCLTLGVHGITVHPRPDERHVRYSDVPALARLLQEFPHAELNIEGNPSPRFVALVLEAQPHQVTLVPDADDQLTSDHGWDAVRDLAELRRVVAVFRDAKIRTSLFMDPVPEQVEAASRTGAERIELYTEAYASSYGSSRQSAVIARYADAARQAAALGLGVNAGHDLNLDNLPTFLREVPDVLEVSIGHAVVCECLELGLKTVLERYLDIVSRGSRG